MHFDCFIPVPMSTEQAKHLEFVQNAVTRMASNSFLLKGWTVTIAYFSRVDPDKLKPHADDDADACAWHFADDPPPLAFDHAQILPPAHSRGPFSPVSQPLSRSHSAPAGCLAETGAGFGH